MRRLYFLALFAIVFAACGVRSSLIDDTNNGDGGGNCGNGATMCGSTCTVTQFDPNNCGACGTKCASGQSCVSGACTSSVCNGGTTQCGDKCVDIENDPANCGTCGNACPVGRGVLGRPVRARSATAARPSAANLCVDTQSDPKNCGVCGNVCPGKPRVLAGRLRHDVPRRHHAVQRNLRRREGRSRRTAARAATRAPAARCARGGACALTCGGGLTKCGEPASTRRTIEELRHVRQRLPGHRQVHRRARARRATATTTDCDGDGWIVSDGDCCDKPGLCGAEPRAREPGRASRSSATASTTTATASPISSTRTDTLPCDAGPRVELDERRSTTPRRSASAADDAERAAARRTRPGACSRRADPPRRRHPAVGSLAAISIRPASGSIIPADSAGRASSCMSSGIASDATQTMPGPERRRARRRQRQLLAQPASAVDIATCTNGLCIKDWFATREPAAQGRERSCPTRRAAAASPDPSHRERLGDARTHACARRRTRKAFSFNSYFFSAEYPEYVCTHVQRSVHRARRHAERHALADRQPGRQEPDDVHAGRPEVADRRSTSPRARASSRSATRRRSEPSCCGQQREHASRARSARRSSTGTGFEKPNGDTCTIGGGTYWLTTAGNVIPGDIVAAPHRDLGRGRLRSSTRSRSSTASSGSPTRRSRERATSSLLRVRELRLAVDLVDEEDDLRARQGVRAGERR